MVELNQTQTSYAKDALAQVDKMDHILKNFHALKQSWPYTRKPILSLNTDSTISIPPSPNRKRIGSPDKDIFDKAGIRDITSVLNITEVYGNIDNNSKVLDWGVGCGRVAKHIPESLRQQFIGVDVDPKNIKWCKDNISWGRYETILPTGRLPVEDNSIQLLYGVSVLTHLSEVDQAHWLQEINRVLTGLAVLSVHGLFSVTSTEWATIPYQLEAWLEYGYRDAETPNPDIADVTDKEYYRNVAHTPEYIKRCWSKYIEVIDIIPAGISYYHDAVVCRKKI